MGSAVIRVKVNRQGLVNSLKAFDSEKTVTKIAQLAVDMMEPYVPYRSGNLRKSVEIAPYSVDGKVRIDYSPDPRTSSSSAAQGLDNISFNSMAFYGHYIYEGDTAGVMGPNKRTMKNPKAGVEGGAWYSPPGELKSYTGQKMTYHTAGTRGHWDEVIQKDGELRDEFVRRSKQIIKDAMKSGDY